MSNCVFNFNILALVLSGILGGPKFTLGGPVPPCTPTSGNFFVPEASTLLYLMVFFNFNFLALSLSEILGGPKFTLWGPASGKILTCVQVHACIYIIVNFQLRSCIHAGFLGDFGGRG